MALYIAGVMWISIVLTAILIHGLFALLGITPESSRAVDEVTRFAVDYTFWLNLVMTVVAAAMVLLHRAHRKKNDDRMNMDMEGDGPVKRAVVYVSIAVLAGGLVSLLFTSW